MHSFLNSTKWCISSVTWFLKKVDQLEQQARSNSIEIQCVPEGKQENIRKIVMNWSQVIDCKLDQSDIKNCTRIAKLKEDEIYCSLDYATNL